MTYYQFTEKHRLTLRNRLLQAGIPTNKNATVSYLEHQCYQLGLDTDIDLGFVADIAQDFAGYIDDRDHESDWRLYVASGMLSNHL